MYCKANLTSEMNRRILSRARMIRCVAKYLEIHERIGKKLTEISMKVVLAATIVHHILLPGGVSPKISPLHTIGQYFLLKYFSHIYFCILS